MTTETSGECPVCGWPKGHCNIGCTAGATLSSEPGPRYSCFAEGCPGDHPGKYGVCNRSSEQRCEGRYAAPGPRHEPFAVTYRCPQLVGHSGQCGPEAAPQSSKEQLTIAREAMEHVLAVFKSMADRGAYPRELMRYDDHGNASRYFLGKQGWEFLTDAIKACSQDETTDVSCSECGSNTGGHKLTCPQVTQPETTPRRPNFQPYKPDWMDGSMDKDNGGEWYSVEEVDAYFAEKTLAELAEQNGRCLVEPIGGNIGDHPRCKQYPDCPCGGPQPEKTPECLGCKEGWDRQGDWHWDQIGHMHECTAEKTKAPVCDCTTECVGPDARSDRLCRAEEGQLNGKG